MSHSYKEIEQKTRRYWFVDGLNEIALGGLCLLPGIYFQVQGSLKTAPFLRLLLGVGLVLFTPILLLKAVKFLKERITYPRTGYVSYGQPSLFLRLAISLLAAAVALVLTAIYLVAPVGVNWMAGLTGLALAIASLIIGWRFQLSRFLVLSLVSLGGGVFLALTQLDGIAGVFAMYFLEGAALLVSGGLTFWAYIRGTQPANETES
jgi:hypothetical protein